MGRNRVPTSILEARGSFEQNPQRRRKDPTVRGGLGRCPDFLKPDEKQAWREIVKQVPERVLAVSDRILVETTARLVAKQRRDPEFSSRLCALLISCLSKLGLTPADRSKVSQLPPPEDDDVEKYFFGGITR